MLCSGRLWNASHKEDHMQTHRALTLRCCTDQHAGRGEHTYPTCIPVDLPPTRHTNQHAKVSVRLP